MLPQEQFLQLEANPVYKFGVEKNMPLLLNPSVLSNFVLLSLLMLSFRIYKKYGHYSFMVIMISIVGFLGGAHLMGGLSWLL